MLIRKDVLQLAGPVFTEQLFITSMGVINTIIASGIGKEAISAIGTVDSLNNIIIFFFNSLAVGGTVVVSQYMGQRKEAMAREAAKQAILSGVAISAFITLVVLLLKGSILNSFLGNAEQQVITYSKMYFSITLFNYPLTAFSFVVTGILRSTGQQDKPMKINIIINIINICLSYFLIYGFSTNNSFVNFTFEGMGVRGAAIAITTARFIGVILFLFTMLDGTERIRLNAIKEFRLNFNPAIQKSILGVGFPAGVETFVFNIGKFVQQIFIITLGTVSMASNTIGWSVFGLLTIPGNALSIVATTMVGKFVGMKEPEEAKKISIYLVKIATVCKIIISLVVFPLATAIAGIYSKDPEVVRLTSLIIRINAITIPLMWPASFVIPSGLRGAGDSKFTMVVSIATLWFFRVFIGYILSIKLHFGIIGLWTAMYFDWALRGIVYYTRLQRGKWLQKQVI